MAERRGGPGLGGIIFILVCAAILGFFGLKEFRARHQDKAEVKYISQTDDVPMADWLSIAQELSVVKERKDGKREVTVSTITNPEYLEKTMGYYRDSMPEFGWQGALDQKDIQTFVKDQETLSILYLNKGDGELAIRFEIAPTDGEWGENEQK